MEITIKVTGLDRLADAILALAGAIQGGNTPTQVPQPIQQTVPQAAQSPTQQIPPIQAIPQQIQTQVQGFAATSQQPAQQVIPTQQSIPPQTQQAQIPTIPTTALPQGFNVDQLAIAATSLVDAGKRDILMGILSQFGVQYLTQVSPENYPALAARLREAGAMI